MKTITLLLVSLFSVSSFACLSNGQMKICPRDAASADHSSGTVIGINPYTKLVTIDFAQGSLGIRTYDVDKVTVGKGCVDGFCVGNPGSADHSSGKIVGVNPTKKLVTIEFDKGSTGIRTYGINRVTVGKGCISGFCVGDAGNVDHSAGQIIGINPSTRQISINFTRGTLGVRTYDINRVTISNYCLQFDENNPLRYVSNEAEFQRSFKK